MLKGRMRRVFQTSFLLKEWIKIHIQAGVTPSLSEFRRLIQAYDAEGRFYHTSQHISECLHFVNRHYGFNSDLFLVKFALFYHDYEYDVKSNCNEEESRDRWLDYVSRIKKTFGSRPSDVLTVCDLILQTKTHKVPAGSTLLVKIMNDADMHIFLCPDHHYLDYAKNVAREFSVFGREPYIKGRIAFLESLDVSSMFYTHQAREMLRNARANRDLELTILDCEPDRLLA